jgi:hypothetical protein
VSAYLNKDGIYSGDRIVNYTTQGSTGARVNLGFFGAGGANYCHVKTSAGANGERMHKFEYNGYTYSSLNVHNSVTLYTYAPQSTPYEPSLVNWGETTGGIVNYYYSSDDYLVIVLQTSAAYTGGFLYHQSGRSHTNYDIDVLAFTSTTSTSGAY